MSRIGKIPVEIPAGVKIRRDDSIIKVEGPKGKLSMVVPKGIDVVLGDKTAEVKRPSDDRRDRSYHGTGQDAPCQYGQGGLESVLKKPRDIRGWIPCRGREQDPEAGHRFFRSDRVCDSGWAFRSRWISR